MSDYNNFYKGGEYKPKNTEKKWSGGGQGGYKSQYKDPPVPENYKIYMPVAFFAERGTPEEKIKELVDIMEDVVKEGYIVRYTGHGELRDEAARIPDESKEIYIPWRGFADIDSKFRFNDNLSMHVAKMFHRGWDKLPETVQKFLATNARCIFGNKMMQHVRAVVLWTPDGAEDEASTSRETGNLAHTIAMASNGKIPVFNIESATARARLLAHLDIGSDSDSDDSSTTSEEF